MTQKSLAAERPVRVVQVIPVKNGWGVRFDGRIVSVHRSRNVALERGQKLARRTGSDITCQWVAAYDAR